MSREYRNNFLKETEDKLVILLYHGVTSHKNKGICNRQGKHIPSEEFRRQMEFIKNNCYPLSIDEWIEIRESSSIPKNPVVISFDDGFENNYTTALPILEALQIPAIFYISSGMIGTKKMFWVDTLEDLINRTKQEQITMKLDKEIQFSLKTEDEKFLALLNIKAFCKKESNKTKNRVIDELIEQTKIEPSCNNPNYPSMNWNQLIELDKKNLFTVGGHSLNHSILSALSDDELNEEISKSLEILENKLNHQIEHYSYPEGQEIHYNQNVIDILKMKGILCSPSAINGINNYQDDLFHLKRIMVGFDGIKFPYDEDL